MALRKRHREAEVSTDSLSDIMFFLMLFFLILSTMISPNAMKVNLASSKNTPPKIESKKKIMHLAVTKDRKFFLDSQELSFSELESAVAAQIKGEVEPMVVLNIDKDLSWQDAIDVMQIGDRLKCKMVVSTKASNGK
jgi:biopolymer transport protein ExbD